MLSVTRSARAGCLLLLARAQLHLGISWTSRDTLLLGAVLQAALSADGVCAGRPALLYKAGTGRGGRASQGRRAMQGQSCGLPALGPALVFLFPPLTVALTLLFFKNVDHFKSLC